MSLLCNKFPKNRTYVNFLLQLINHRMKSIAVTVDPLDIFTTHLVQEKANKWENLRLKTNLVQKTKLLGSKEIYSDDLNSGLQEGIEENNVDKIMEILDQCKENKTRFNVTIVLRYFAQIGYIDGIKLIQQIYEEIDSNVLKYNAHFQHYLAEAIWVKGNIPKALEIFYDIYKNNINLRTNIRIVLKYLIHKASQNNSEATMVAMSRFCEKLSSEFQDFKPLINLWKICILSDWYGDQLLANDLLERNEHLIKALLPQISQILIMALKNHKIESVYRLLEILLKYNCKSECSMVLISLFDYKLRQRDLYSCTQILKWSTKNNILVPSLHQEKVVSLLLKVNNKTIKDTKGLKHMDYNLKF